MLVRAPDAGSCADAPLADASGQPTDSEPVRPGLTRGAVREWRGHEAAAVRVVAESVTGRVAAACTALSASCLRLPTRLRIRRGSSHKFLIGA